MATAQHGGQLRLLAVHAHPDDESSKGAATAARYAAEGVQVMVVTCTGGERGDVLNPQFGVAPDSLEGMKSLRYAEMAQAAQALGVQHRWLGFVDSGLPEGDPMPPLPSGCFAQIPLTEPVAALVRVVRDFQPQVMTTYDPQGGYPHPDHIRCHDVSVAAMAAAADPQYLEGQTQPPWQVSKLYYNHDFSIARLRTMHQALEAAGLDSPFAQWLTYRETLHNAERPVTTSIHVADFFPQRDAALRAHASQVDPEGIFFAMPRDLEAQIWPVEDFELAQSLVPTTLPEDDLFAGLRGTP